MKCSTCGSTIPKKKAEKQTALEKALNAPHDPNDLFCGACHLWTRRAGQPICDSCWKLGRKLIWKNDRWTVVRREPTWKNR